MEWTPGPWAPASNGAGKRHWFVGREDTGDYHENSAGRLIRYASYESAKRVADELNEREAERQSDRQISYFYGG